MFLNWQYVSGYLQEFGKPSSCYENMFFEPETNRNAGLSLLAEILLQTTGRQNEMFKNMVLFQVQDSLVQVRDITSQTYVLVSTKSVAIYGQGAAMLTEGQKYIKEGYSMLPPQFREFSDPALDATVKYSQIGLEKAKEGYIQVADVIVEQYHIYLPTINLYWKQVKTSAIDIGSKALDKNSEFQNAVAEIVKDTYEKVSPQVRYLS